MERIGQLWWIIPSVSATSLRICTFHGMLPGMYAMIKPTYLNYVVVEMIVND